MKKMSVLLMSMSILFSPVMHSQVGHEQKKEERRAQIHAQKVSFFTTKMELTPEEAEKFWPIYNKYEEKRMRMRQEGKAARGSKKIEEMTETEMTAMVDRKVEMNITKAQMEKEFVEEVKKVLPIKKVLLMHRAEREFKRQLVKNLKSKAKDHARH